MSYLHDPDTATALVIVRFNTTRQARQAHAALNALFDDIDAQVDDLFARQGGEATLEQVARIYAKFGLTNDTGWAQAAPITVAGNEVAWPLPYGVRRSDVEDLLMAMEPQSIEFFDISEGDPEWQMAPVPEMPYPIDEWDDEDDLPGPPPKRVLH